MVIHDSSVDQTTNGTGLVRDMTYRQVARPGRGVQLRAGPERGARAAAGVVSAARRPDPPPEAADGYRASDFAIPSLHQVLATFRNVPINIEIKGTSDTDTASFLHNARLLAELLNRTHRTDIIVTSFNDLAIAKFHRLAPRIALAPGMNEADQLLPRRHAADRRHGRPADPGAVQRASRSPPRTSSPAPTPTGTRSTSGSAAPRRRTRPTYNTLIDACADGIMAAWPTLLERILDERGIARPGTPGIDPCATR